VTGVSGKSSATRGHKAGMDFKPIKRAANWIVSAEAADVELTALINP
jgi:hypothetical protein